MSSSNPPYPMDTDPPYFQHRHNSLPGSPPGPQHGMEMLGSQIQSAISNMSNSVEGYFGRLERHLEDRFDRVRDQISAASTGGTASTNPMMESQMIQSGSQMRPTNTNIPVPGNEALEKRIEELSNENRMLQSALDHHKDDSGEVQNLQRQLTEAQVKARASQDKIKQLTAIIMQSSTQESGPDENKMARTFDSVRYETQNIAGNYCNYEDSPKPKKLTASEESKRSHARLWGDWGKITTDDRKRRVRAIIFDVLYRRLFGFPCFGLESESEYALSNFEIRLKNSAEISENERIEWRKRTVLAAQKIHSSQGFVEDVANQLAETLRPILLRDKIDVCRKELYNLSKTSLEVAQSMRSTSQIYEVLSPERGSDADSLPDGSFIAECSAQREPPVVGEVLFGALIAREKDDARSERAVRVVRQGYFTTE